LKPFSSWLLVGVLASIGVAVPASGAIAQSTDLDPAAVFETDDDGPDAFGDTSNPFELIHRAILSPSVTLGEFQERQQRAISGEAQDFRLRQQEAIRQGQQPTVGVSDDPLTGEDL
jgi:hypothetical protein